MSSNRCFNTLNKTIVNSSDLTSSRRQTTIYKEIANNSTSVTGPDPVKKDGSTYNANFIVKGTAAEPCLASAKNYELLLDITKGKRFANPLLDGAASAKYEMWVGNVLEANYHNKGVVPVRGLDGVGSGTIEDAEYNAILFPSPCVDDCSWNSSVYPGFTIDPSQTLFYALCDDSDKLAPYIRNVCDVSFKNTNYYWKAASAQPLSGMKYPAPLKLRFQDTIATQYAPLASGGGGISGEWCAGKHAFN
jgi:hypothetical protein